METTDLATVAISLMSLLVSIYALRIARESSSREEEMHVRTLGAALSGELKDVSDHLTIRTTEQDKLLLNGTMFFPAFTELEPLGFYAPLNVIPLSQVSKAVRKVMESEVDALERDHLQFRPKSAVVVNLALPVFMEYIATSGGVAVRNLCTALLIFQVAFVNEDEQPGPLRPNFAKFHCFQYFERVSLGFWVFAWPWEWRFYPRLIADRFARRRIAKIQASLNELWEEMRLSRIGGPLRKHAVDCAGQSNIPLNPTGSPKESQ